MKKKNIGLFFGSFNPIHVGHLIIANHLAEYSPLDEVWFVITPHNPFKKKSSLLENHHRYELAFLATEKYPKLQVSDIEFKLPQPNYTITTLYHISQEYPQHQFSLIMGEDNLNSFHKWKNYEAILEDYQLFVYPRIDSETGTNQFENHPKITKIDAPIIEISSTMIRKAIKQNKECRPLLPIETWQYIDEMNFYKK